MALADKFDWGRWGKADKATAEWMIARMPDDMKHQLNKSEREVLSWVLYFAWKGSVTGTGSPTSTFLSQLYVAEKIGKSRWTTARALDRLTEYGMIRSLKRLKTKAGEWKPRFLILQGKLMAFLAYLSGQTKPKSPCSKTAPHESYKSNKGVTTSSSESSSPLREDFRNENELGYTGIHPLLRPFANRSAAS